MTRRNGTVDRPAFELLEVLGEGRRTIVYRAKRGERLFALKLLRHSDDVDAEEERARFTRGALRFASVEHPGLVPLLETGAHESQPYALFSIVNGSCLRCLGQEGPHPEPRVLSVAKSAAGALAALHARGLLHGDLKPENVILCEGDRLCLVDPELLGVRSIVTGHLAHLTFRSPERLGLLEHPVDARSDLYSLGATLFQMATGRAPFRAADPRELLRQRREGEPPSARSIEPRLSPALAAILHKLIAHEVTDRYSSAESLLLDLREIDTLNIKALRGHPLPLDTLLPKPITLEPVPLVDRVRELDEVVGAFMKAADGHGSVCLIEGAAGTGKSRLISELIRTAARKSAVVMRTKCLEGENLPFAEARRAIDEWLSRGDNWLGGDHPTPSEALVEAGAGISNYLGRFWPRLVDFFPRRPGPPPIPLPSAIETSVGELFLRLSTITGPLVLVVEDFQWLSSSSAHVLDHIASRIEKHRFLVVLTGDSAEIAIGRGMLVQRRLRASRPMRARLSSLTGPSLRALVASMLGRRKVPDSWPALLEDHPRANPLHIIEKVEALLAVGVISLRGGEWSASDESRVLEILGGSLEEAMLTRLSVLSPLARDALSYMSILGHCCKPDLLVRALGSSRTETHLALAELLESALILWSSPRDYIFSHDSLRNLVLSIFDEKKAHEAHKRLADAVAHEADDRVLADCVAATLLARPGIDIEPRRLLSVSFSAGCAALRARAYDEATPYLRTCLQASTRLARLPPGLETALLEALGEALYQTGRTVEAEGHLRELLELSSHGAQRARAHGRLADILMLDLRTEEAWGELVLAFDALGKKLGGETDLFRSLCNALSVPFIALTRAFSRQSVSDARRDRLLVDLYLRAGQVGYLSLEPTRLVDMRLAAMLPAARLGLSAEQAAVLSHHSLLLSSSGRRRVRRRLEEARRFSTSLSDPAVTARMTALGARSATQLGEIKEAERLARSAIDDMSHWLDKSELVFTAADLSMSLTIRGKANEAWQLAQRVFLDPTSDEPRRPALLQLVADSTAMASLAVLGRFRTARYHLERADDRLGRRPRDAFSTIVYLTSKLIVQREQRELGRPVEDTLSAFEALGIVHRKLPLHVLPFLVMKGYVGVDRCSAHSPEHANGSLAALNEAVEQLSSVAHNPLLSGHAKILSAALLRLRGKYDSAMRGLEGVESIADSIDSPWVVYEASCEKARILLATGRPEAAKRAASVALEIARQNAWRPRVRRVKAEFSIHEPTRLGRAKTRSRKDHLTQALEMALWATNSASAASQVRTLLDWLIRLFGAERAFMLQYDDERGELSLVTGKDLRGNDLAFLEQEGLGLSARAIDTRRTLVSQTLSHPARRDNGKAPSSRAPRRAVAAPMLHGRRVKGVLYIDHRLADALFTSADIEALGAIASHVPRVLEVSDEARLTIYERLAANVPGLVFQFVEYPDGKKSYRFVSSNVRSLGLSPDEARRDAEVLLSHIHPEDRASFDAALERSGKTQRPWHWEGRYLLPNGNVRWFYGAARPERQPGGSILWDGLIMDITRRRIAEERIRSLNLELEARVAARTEELVLANRELEAFTYSVSHDLRTPLMTIQGFAEELASLPRDSAEEASQFIGRILCATKQMESLIESMLSLSRIAHQPLQRKAVSLSSTAHEILESLHRQHPERQVLWTIDGDLYANADAALVRVLLENLIGNAWKFTGHLATAHIRVSRRHLDGEESFVVEDDGIGFDMELAPLAFQPFHRLHSAEKYEGSGIGLATVRRIVQRHGGRVWAESRPGFGSSFHFTLGKRSKAAAEAPRERPKA